MDNLIPNVVPNVKAIIRMDVTDAMHYTWLYTWGQAIDKLKTLGDHFNHVAIRYADGCIQVDIF